MNKAMPHMRELARRLLACEAALGNPSMTEEQAIVRVYEKLRKPLSTLAGAEGFRSLLARSLSLAKTEAPSLAAVRITSEGSLSGWDSGLRSRNLEDAGVCEEVLLAYLLGLLFTFIGQPLTMRFVKDAYPEGPFTDMISELEKPV